MKNASKNTKSFFYELPQHMRSPIDDYYLIIISNSELEFDDRISNMKKLHPNLLSFMIHVGPIAGEYADLKGISHYFRKTFSQSGKGIADMIEYINKFSLEHSDQTQKPIKKNSFEKNDFSNKHLGVVFIVDSGLEFLGNYIDKLMEDSTIRREVLSLTEIKKVDFDCDSVLIFFNSSAVLDPKKALTIDQTLTAFGKDTFHIVIK
jgi:hypothetical protein